MTVLDDFMTRGARLRGITVRQSKFRKHGEALWLGKTELAHCHNGDVDDWILVRVRRTADVERALQLLRHAIRAARTIAP